MNIIPEYHNAATKKLLQKILLDKRNIMHMSCIILARIIMTIDIVIRTVILFQSDFIMCTIHLSMLEHLDTQHSKMEDIKIYVE